MRGDGAAAAPVLAGAAGATRQGHVGRGRDDCCVTSSRGIVAAGTLTQKAAVNDCHTVTATAFVVDKSARRTGALPWRSGPRAVRGVGIAGFITSTVLKESAGNKER